MTTREMLERLAAGESTKEETKQYLALLHRAGHAIKIDRGHLPTRPEPAKNMRDGNGLPSKEQPELCGAELNGARKEFLSELREMISRALKIEAMEIDLDRPVAEYGLSSITVTALLAEFNARFGTSVAPTVLFEFSNLRAFGDYLFSQSRGHCRTVCVAEQGRCKLESSIVSEEPQQLTESSLNRQYLQSIAPDKELQQLWVEAEMALQAESKAGAESGGSASPQNETVVPVQEETSGNDVKSFRLRTAKEAQRSRTADPVAIIGMAGIMPQCDDLGAFWEALRQGRNLITEVPSERWDWRRFLDEQSADDPLTGVRWGGFLKQVDGFDASFFGISPYEAKLMDPQQRLFLQVVWHTLEDAGYKASDLAGTSAGVYVGVSTSDYFELMRERNVSIDAHTATGYAHSILANRISYLFDFHGPSEPIDTACSSSLVAVHRAVEALQSGSCDLAIAGGVNLLLTPTMFVSFAKAGMLSPDGRCKSFDQRANGYVRGEGAAAILLKPLSRALAAGDQIYALIRGSAENHGGRATSMTAPNPNAQADLLVDAYTRAGVDPATVTYIEAHGTGTQLGDPLEVTGLTRAFARLYEHHGISNRAAPHCGIGSVKANIGHLESAAGIAGVVKTLLAMQHQFLPPNPNLFQPNPYIALEGSPFFLIAKGEPWRQLVDTQNQPIPLRAGVSSFGFGGAYAHVILEKHAPAVADLRANERDIAQPVLISAATSQCLDAYVRRWAAFTENCLNYRSARQAVAFRDVAFTSRVGRTNQAHRLALIAASFFELNDLLQKFLNGLEDSRILRAFEGTGESRTTGGLTNGMGPDAVRSTSSPKDLLTLARLWSEGHDVNWPETESRRVSIPLYPFRQICYWFDGETTTLRGPNANRAGEQGTGMSAPSPLFYGEQWTETPLSIDGSLRAEHDLPPVLIVGPRLLLDAVFESEIIRNLSVKMQLVLASCENEFGTVKDNFYRVNSQDEAGFDHLFDSLMARGIHLRCVIFFSESLLPSCLESRIAKNYLFKERSENNLRAFFSLSQAMLKREWGGKVSGHCFVHASGGIDHAREAALSAFSLSGYLENDGFTFHTIELEGNSWSAESLTRLAIQETMVDRQAPEEVLYRDGNRRYVRVLHECRLAQGLEKRAFRQRGTYLIAGGLGELGKCLAGYLSRLYKCTVILLGRRPLTVAVESELAGIERGEGTLMYYQADICDGSKLSDTVDRIRAQRGQFHGVFHLARTVEDSPVVSKDFEGFVRVSDAKIAGTLNLDAATARDPLDFFIMFSSIAADWGVAGAADYAYACSFQNRFAAIREQWSKSGHRTGKSLAIGWPQWGYDRYSNPARNRFLEEHGFRLLEVDIGLRILEQALFVQNATVAFAYGDLRALRPLLEVRARKRSFAKGPAMVRAVDPLVSKSSYGLEEIRNLLENLPEEELNELYTECIRDPSCNSLGNGNDASLTAQNEFRTARDWPEGGRPSFQEITRSVRGVVGEVLHCDPLSIDGRTAFERYGMDSILSVKIARRLGRLFRLTLSPKWLIEQPTVDLLAHKIQNLLAGVHWERHARQTDRN